MHTVTNDIDIQSNSRRHLMYVL